MSDNILQPMIQKIDISYNVVLEINQNIVIESIILEIH